MSKSLVQQQFGAHAEEYATSKVHAQGASLARLVDLVTPQPHWHLLDVATAAGHTAFAFAPFVARVTATDITPEMIPVAQRLAAERGLTNLEFATADAEELPYPEQHVDLVTCRIAPHHFPHIDRFVREAYRVLKPGGILAIVDNVVPGDQTDTPAGAALHAAGVYINGVEALRDPSHGRCLSVVDWVTVLRAAGFSVLHVEVAPKRMEFQSWVTRLGASEEVQAEVRRLLVEAPPAAAAFFRVEPVGDDLIFHLEEGILIARRPESA